MSLASTVENIFPTPRFLAMPSVSVALSDRALRLVELANHKKSIRLSGYAEYPLKEGLFTDGQIQDVAGLAEIFEEVTKKFRFSFLNAALPEEHGFIYTLPLSDRQARDPASIGEQVAFSLEENVPLSLDEAVFDFEIFKNKEDSSFLTVYVYTHELIDQFLEVFELAGLTALALEPESRALARSVIKQGDDRTHAMIHFKDQVTNISLVFQNQVVFTSTISKGVQDLVAESGQGYIWLKEKLNQVSEYWHAYSSNTLLLSSQVENVVVCGEGLGEEQVIEAVAQQLGPQIELANVWNNVASFDEYIPEISYDDSPRFGIAIGLALEAFLK